MNTLINEGEDAGDMSSSSDQATPNYRTQRTYQIGFDALFPSLLNNLDIVPVALQLEQNGYITSEERQQITEWASGNVPKEDALHSFLHILSKSPLRSLKTALSQCPNSPGHIDLLKQIEAIGGFGRSMDEQGNMCDGKLTESQLSMHDPMVSLSWKKLSSMPIGMQNAQARVLGNKIYVGGGTTGMIDMSSKVYVYDYIYDKWEILPKSPVYNFALEVYDSSILLIGGRDTDSGEVTGEVFFWNQAESIWKEDLLPSMPTARHSASSTTYGQYIVVAGGFALTSPVSNVEVYSGTKLKWLSAQHLPQAQSHMKQVVANGSLILMGGSGAKGGTLLVFSTSLEALISNAEERLLHHGSLAKSVIWKTLPQLPYMHSSAAYFGNSVVAMGREGRVSRSPVYAYSPDTLTWILVSELPFKIENATVIAIPSGDVMILGGLAGEQSEHSKQVYISSLLSSKGKASPKFTRAAIQGESQELLFKERKDLQPPADVIETLPATSVSGATLLRTVWVNTHHTSDRLSSQSSIHNE